MKQCTCILSLYRGEILEHFFTEVSFPKFRSELVLAVKL